MALWTPLGMSNLVAWYDASDFSSITESSGSVSQWDDLSGNGNHLTQGAGANQPSYEASNAVAGNQPAIVWTDSNNQENLQNNVGPITMCHIYMVMAYRDGIDATFDNYNALFGDAADSVVRCMGSSGAAVIHDAATAVYNRASKNGDVFTTTLIPMPLQTVHVTGEEPKAFSDFQLGNEREEFGRNWRGPICEVVALSASAKPWEMVNLEGYLKNKWSTSIVTNHPWRLEPPTVAAIGAVPDDVLSTAGGNWTAATDTLYASGNQYGAGGTSKTGTFSCTAPSQPVLSVVNNDDGTATATIAGASAGTTNTVYSFTDTMTVSPTAVAAISENGSKKFTISPVGLYWFYALSDLSGLTAISTTIERVDVSDGSDTAENSEDQYIRQYGEIFTVQNEVEGRDTNYARTSTWTDSHTAYGWMQPIGSNLALQYEKRELSVTNKVWFAEDPQATEGDRIQKADGTTFVIRGVVDQAGLDRLWRVDVEEQK